MITPRDIIKRYKADWNKFANEVLNVNLDPQQKEILTSIQNNRRVSVRSGNARGKDYVAAVASLCFLYLNKPSKVINTAPTGRQVISIMMAEISAIHQKAKVPLGGEVLIQKIKIPNEPDWFLEGFKAGDKDVESWMGFHSQNLMVVITEASGIDDKTYEAVESILTGNSRLVLVFNPNFMRGESYESTKSPLYEKFKMNCLEAPNVIARKIIYPGQVNWDWIDEKVRKPGWTMKISKEMVDTNKFDFEWEGQWYRPSDLFRIKVLGEYAEEGEDVLIPLAWIEAANDRWLEWKANGGETNGNLRLGVDVAGMGRDNTVFVHKYENIISKIEVFSKQDHMVTAGKIKQRLASGGQAFIDSIGEGAGVFSRCKEQGLKVFSVKASNSAKNMKDRTRQKTFANMSVYLHCELRDILDPQYDSQLALPPDDELTQELTETRLGEPHSNGDITIEPKEKLKTRIGRSPDKKDALLNTLYKSERMPRAMLI